MSTLEPKKIDSKISLMNKDIFKLINKGKFSSFLFTLFILIIYSSLSITLLLYNNLFTQKYIIYSLVFISFFLYFSVFLILSCATQEMLSYTYLKKKFNMEENVDCFFLSFNNIKKMYITIEKDLILFLSILLLIFVLSIYFHTNFDNLIFTKKDYSINNIILIMSKGLFFLLSFTSFYINKRFLLTYLNFLNFNISLKESIILTNKGAILNRNLFIKIDMLFAIYIIFGTSNIYLAFFSIFFIFYYFYFYQCAWQKIFNEQDGVGEKETVKSYNKLTNTVIN